MSRPCTGQVYPLRAPREPERRPRRKRQTLGDGEIDAAPKIRLDALYFCTGFATMKRYFGTESGERSRLAFQTPRACERGTRTKRQTHATERFFRNKPWARLPHLCLRWNRWAARHRASAARSNLNLSPVHAQARSAVFVQENLEGDPASPRRAAPGGVGGVGARRLQEQRPPRAGNRDQNDDVLREQDAEGARD